MSGQILTRIMGRVVVNDATGCWEWTGRLNAWGYGVTNVVNKKWLVHRLVYSIKVSAEIDGLCVCHHCDNPKCCNPSHLWLGTNAQNVADRFAKGRSASGIQNGKYTCPEKVQRGSAVPAAKLTDADVTYIRQALIGVKWGQRTVVQKRLANKYGVALDTLRGALYGKTWKHVGQFLNSRCQSTTQQHAGTRGMQ